MRWIVGRRIDRFSLIRESEHKRQGRKGPEYTYDWCRKRGNGRILRSAIGNFWSTRGCTNDDSSLHVLPAWNSTSMVRRSAMLPYVCTAKVTTTNALLSSSFRKIAWYARTWQPRYPVLVIYSFHIHNRSPINQRCLLFLRCVHPIANIFGESLFSWPFIFTI